MPILIFVILIAWMVLGIEMSTLLLNFPIEIFHEIDSYLNNGEIFKLRRVNRQFKQQAEDYGNRNIIRRKEFGLIRDWQLLLLKTEYFGLKEQIYKPIMCKDHLFLLKFISQYPEFHKLIRELRMDVNGFLKPMILYYETHGGLDEFIKIFECENLIEKRDNNRYNNRYNNRDNNRDNNRCFNHELSSFLILISGLKCLQG
jgi:hypothetical protein